MPWQSPESSTFSHTTAALPPTSRSIGKHNVSLGHRRSQTQPINWVGEDFLSFPESPPAPSTPERAGDHRTVTNSDYYTSAWGSPYDVSPAVRTPSEELSDRADLSESSPIPNFGLANLIPSRLIDVNLPVSAHTQLEKDLEHGVSVEATPRVVSKHRSKLSQAYFKSGEIEWLSQNSEARSDLGQKTLRRSSSATSLPEAAQHRPPGHRSRESNQTLNQQSFWKKLRYKKEDMSDLFASRWADTPPADETPQKPVNTTLFSPKGAELSPPSEPDQKKVDAGIFASRWADTPSPPMELASSRDVKRERSVDYAGEEVKESEENAEIDPGSAANDDERKASAAQDIDISNKGTKVALEDTNKALPELPQSVSRNVVPMRSENLGAVPASPFKLQLDIPRTKKKVSWRGKMCVISIPNLDYEALGLRKPWSLREVQQRLKRFEEEGFDIRGFDMLVPENVSDGPVHAKPIYPDESESSALGTQSRPNVSLPDLQKWSAYMDYLTEQKLAALGVSTGPAEPAVSSPQDTSRQSSAQYPPLPFSPPLPTTSGAGLGRPGMLRGHSHTMSVAAPASPLSGPFGHAHRHSVFTGAFGFQQMQQSGFGGNPMFSPHEQPLTPQSLASGMRSMSPQGYFAIPGFNRADSPAHLAALRNEAGALRGSGSPLNQHTLAQAVQDISRSLSAENINAKQGALSATPNQNGPHFHPIASLPKLPEEDDEDELLEKAELEPKLAPETASKPDMATYVPPHKRAEFNANIAVPTPRGHRHNISEGLERDVLEAEKRQEAAPQDYIVVEEESSSSSTDQKSAGAKVEVTPEKDPLGLGLAVQEVVRSHKKTASRFNVAAQPFKFNPGATFQPGSTAFTFGAPTATTKVDKQPAFAHNRQVSSGAFNVAAPEFKPTGMPTLPKSEFSFTSTGPTFSPNAPSFTTHKHAPTSSGGASSIFGKVEIPDFVRPVRRSKAVAIKKPDDSSPTALESGTEREDEDGRILQSEDRLKRQRKIGDDGDEVPRFAEPTHMPALPTEFVVKSQAAEEHQHTASSTEEQATAGAPGSDEDVTDEDESRPDDASDSEPEPAGGQPQAANLPHAHKHSSSLSALARPFQPYAAVQTQKHIAESAQDSNEEDLEEDEVEESHLITSPFRNGGSSPPVAAILEDFDEAMRDLAKDASESRIPAAHNAEPSFAEIDAVMRQLNYADAHDDLPEAYSISPLPSSTSNVMHGVSHLPTWDRSDAPSPSPRRRELQQEAPVDSSFTIHERMDSAENIINEWPQLNRLNNAAELPTSDWSADFSVQDDEKLNQRANVLDNHIDNLIGRVLEKRLLPLEETLQAIQSSIDRRPVSRDLALKRSSSAADSDADDEDEMSEGQRQRPISRGRDKKTDQIKAAVLEALQEQSPRRLAQPSFDLQDLQAHLADMKASFARATSSGLELEDIRAIIEDAVGRQNEALVPIGLDPNERSGIHTRGPSELESRLNETLAGMLEEANLRRAAEEREAESRRALQYAEEEIRVLRSSTRDYEAQMNTAMREKEDLLQRVEVAEDTQSDLEDQVKNLEKENAATYATLEEYRTSSNKWRTHIDELTGEREDLDNEMGELKEQLKKSQESAVDLQKVVDGNAAQRHELSNSLEEVKSELEKSQESTRTLRGELHAATRQRDELESTMAALERELTESHESNSGTKRRLEALHSDLAGAAGQLTSERSIWASKESEHVKKHESLEAQIAAHAEARSRLESQVRDLQSGAKEAAEARSVLDQMKLSKTSLDDMVRNLHNELTEQQTLAKRLERELEDAKEAGRVDIQRLQASSERDVEAANHKVTVVLNDFESQVSRLQSELQNTKAEAESAKTRHVRTLEEELSAREEQLRKVSQAHSTALDEAHLKHQTSLTVLRADHDRVLGHAIEDKQRSESFLNERLALADAKVQHFQDKISYLEERVEVAKSAAQAAAVRAQPRRLSPAVVERSTLPEKVSPQALRESILVLQDQLQDREAQIEQLQSQLNDDASGKLKSRDDEIAWLRELLAVRSEDLMDLINTLSRPTFDRRSVRDLAIRIRANLQMEQQEKERSGGSQQNASPSQAIANLTNLATPKAIQLTSAFNKWRSSMESSALKSAAVQGPSRARSDTPSKAPISTTSAPLGYTLGLMTPPASNLRNTPSPEAAPPIPPPRLHSRTTSRTPSDAAPLAALHPGLKSRQASASSEIPATPLFRSQSYDDDAPDHRVHMQSFGQTFDGEDDDLDGAVDEQPPAFRNLEAELEDVHAGAEEVDGEEADAVEGA